MEQDLAVLEFLKALRAGEEVNLCGREALVCATGDPFEDDDFLPFFGYDVV